MPGVWSHEIDFWGGDLRSLTSKLDYLTSDLGIDVLYLNPIHLAYTNHKYDAQDYFQVSPEYGTRDDVKRLAAELHHRGRRLVLDGVFNHMGRTSGWFKEAMADPRSPRRDWFSIGPAYKLGYRAWYDVANLPELRLENPAVRARIYGDRDSVIQGYLRDGVDGWRLDVAFDIGYDYLDELTRAAHRARPGSLIVGEIWNYPENWFPSIDGIMNMTAREIILKLATGEISAPLAGRHFERIVADCGLDPLLKSWIILDNHDTPRLRTVLPEPWQQRLAQVLQFTLPGSPCVYYGVEVGMQGGDDPQQRGPMQWDQVRDDNAALAWMKQLVAMHRKSRGAAHRRLPPGRGAQAVRLRAPHRACRPTASSSSSTHRPPRGCSKSVLLTDSKLMDGTPLVDLLGRHEPLRIASSMLDVTLPAHGFLVLQPDVRPQGGYTNYKRVQ